MEQVTEAPPQQLQQQHTDVQTVAVEPFVAGEPVQQRTVEQVIERATRASGMTSL